MPKVLETILYLVLFIVCLSILIMIHELGHFTAAKIFKVYVREYSIGFGPALIHKKRKNGETYFSLRVVPFGGYVSMYGEGVELDEGEQIDESRSLDKIKKWKKAIILVAGVTMNAVLAILLFFIYNVGFDKSKCYLGNIGVTEGSKIAESGIVNGDAIALDSYIDETKKNYTDDLHLLDADTVVTYTNGETDIVYSYIDTTKVENYKNLNLNQFLVFYQSKYDEQGVRTVNWSKQLHVNAEFESALVNFRVFKRDASTGKYAETMDEHPITILRDAKTGGLEDFGYSLYLDVRKPMSFFPALGQAFVDFGNSSTLIVRTLGTLFAPSTWNNVGGIVAVGFTTTYVLQNFGFGMFIYYWGAISVNLAIVNLLPFPGLDGWQLLVLAIEGISRKKVPDKVKTIVSFAGIALLFVFMAVLVVKDILTFMI